MFAVYHETVYREGRVVDQLFKHQVGQFHLDDRVELLISVPPVLVLVNLE